MSNLTQIWIFVGVFLWGLPTALIVSFIVANLTFEGGIQLTEFSMDRFKYYCFVLIPFFSMCGFFLGLYMGQLSEKHRQQSRGSIR